MVRSQKKTAEPEPGLRADARRNRAQLLTAAHALFCEQGAGVSLDEIAKRAQLGIGTLYRHFPSREALLAAACDERLLELAEHSRARTPEARTGSSAHSDLRTFLEALVRHASTYRGLAASLGVVLRNESEGCHATSEEGRRLLARAQRAGEVRADVAFEDVVCMATAISLAAAESAEGAQRIPKLVEMFTDGLRTPAPPAKRRR